MQVNFLTRNVFSDGSSRQLDLIFLGFVHQESMSLRCLRCGGKNRLLVVLENLQPGIDIAGMVVHRGRNQAQIRAAERRAQLGDQFLESVRLLLLARNSQLSNIALIRISRSRTGTNGEERSASFSCRRSALNLQESFGF